MKTFFLVGALLGFCAQATAADLPVKPRALTPNAVPTNGCGPFFGFGTSGQAGVVNNSPVPGASIVQGELGVHAGYACINPDGSFYFGEADFNWVNGNGSTNGLSLTGPVDLFQRVGYGSPIITTILTSFPGLNGLQPPPFPIMPTGVTAGPAVPYIYGGVHEQDVSAQFINPATGTVFGTNKIWGLSGELGVGFWSRWSNNVVADVSAGYRLQSTGVCIGLPGGQCPGMGNMWTAGVKFHF